MNQARYFLPHLYALSVRFTVLSRTKYRPESLSADDLRALSRTGIPDAFDSLSE